MAIYSLRHFSVKLSHNNSQEAHELAKQVLYRSRKQDGKGVDGRHRAAIGRDSRARIQTPTCPPLSPYLSLLTRTPFPDTLTDSLDPAHGNTVVSAIFLVVPKTAVPALTRHW